MNKEERAQIKERFKNDLLKAMNERNMKQIDLCKATGINSGNISPLMKSGTSNASDTVKAIAKCLKLDISYMKGGRDYSDTADYPRVSFRPSSVEGRWVCDTEYSDGSTKTELITSEEKDIREGKKPTLIEVNDLSLNDEKRTLWVNGAEFDEAKIRELITDAEDAETALANQQERCAVLDAENRKLEEEKGKLTALNYDLTAENQELNELVGELRDELVRTREPKGLTIDPSDFDRLSVKAVKAIVQWASETFKDGVLQ